MHRWPGLAIEAGIILGRPPKFPAKVPTKNGSNSKRGESGWTSG